MRATTGVAAVVALAACDKWVTRPSLYNSVDVVATRRNGEPIPGVDLVLYTGARPVAYATTESDGRFRFTLVPKGVYGVYATLPDGYELLERLTASKPTYYVEGLRVADDTLSPVHFSFLKRGPGTVTSRVLDAAGKPMVGIPALLYGPTRKIDSAFTDANGLVTFKNVPFGVYGVVITRPQFFRSYNRFEDSAYTSRDGILVDEGSTDSVRFVLSRCAAKVRFRVTDERGDPVFFAMASFYSTREILGAVFTDRLGNGEFETTCATPMGVFIYPPGGYVAVEGRGTQYYDGISLASGAVLDLSFKVRKTP